MSSPSANNRRHREERRRAAAGPVPAAHAPNRTPVLSFTGRESFNFRQQNASQGQTASGGGAKYLTTSDLFLREMILKHPSQFRVLEPRCEFPCEPLERWKALDLDGKRVLFLLPSQALGGNVATVLGIAALKEKFRLAEAAVFCAKSATDIFAAMPEIRVYPFWIAEKELRRYHHVFDLGHIEARRDIEIWPVDMEAEILSAFGAAPAARFPAEARPIGARRPLSIGILPLGSSPLRTLPVAVTRDLAAALLRRFGGGGGGAEVAVFLNRGQSQGRLYQKALAEAQVEGLRIVEGFDSIAALLRAIDGLDYAVFADSGPAHISKLFRTPGTAVYTSAPGDVLQGRFRNLARWTVPYKGPHCEAPCGLAKLRATAAGRFGCMGSLGVKLEALPTVAKASDPSVVEQFFSRAPVPCVAELARDHGALVEFVLEDLERRLRGGTGVMSGSSTTPTNPSTSTMTTATTSPSTIGSDSTTVTPGTANQPVTVPRDATTPVSRGGSGTSGNASGSSATGAGK